MNEPACGVTILKTSCVRLLLVVIALSMTELTAVHSAQEPATEGAESKKHLLSFERIPLTETYYSEGAAAGDLNRDGHMDIVYGPYWFAGPEHTERAEIYPVVAQPTERYADHFFAWVHDFDDDGWQDVFVVGFPGTPAFVYENPGEDGFDDHWAKHEVIDWVSNESPYFGDLLGDGRPELVCTRDGFFGFATIDWEKPFAAWKFHPISEQIASPRFGHGLGVGDVNDDGRQDIIHAAGWFEQPEDGALENRWVQRDAAFTNAYGGAEMHAYDVDGDGDSDIITSLAAHEFGLAWFEKSQTEDGYEFEQHLIMGATPAENRYGVVFSELHSVNLQDMDGDGLKDIVTGKTYWSHHRQSPLWNAGAVVYYFRLVREDSGIDWVPHRLDDQAGIGRQLGVFDVNQDDLPDIVVGGMKGCHVLVQNRKEVDSATWQDAQPQPIEVNKRRIDRGELPEIDEQSKQVANAVEAETMNVAAVSRGNVRPQDMSGFGAASWSGQQQLFWTGGEVGSELELDFDVGEPGRYEVFAILSSAMDYGRVQLSLNGESVGPELDLFSYPDVKTTGLVSLGKHDLNETDQRLTIKIVGSHPSAVPALMVGIDCLQLIKQ